LDRLRTRRSDVDADIDFFRRGPQMTSTTRRRKATLTAGAIAVALLVLAPFAARGQTDTRGSFAVQAFTPPSPATAQPSAPSVANPSSPSAPAGGPTPEMAGYAPPEYGTEGGIDDGTGTHDGEAQYAGEGAPLIPPDVESAPYQATAGGYCYVGPHPADTRVVPGASWDPTTGQHVRPYPPLDTRLFAYHNGCYYFTGDPRDFGYAGQSYAYYGAHPVLAAYGGGWCFMMGGHAHLWAPWSPYFTVVGPWYYWQGAYDPFFWTYWPYYSFYYRSYYPHYYGGGRFYRGGYRVAPPIHSVPPSAWRGAAPGRGVGFGHAAPVTRGAPMQMNRMAPQAAPQSSYGPAQRPAFSPGPRPGFSPGPRPSFSPGPRPSFSPSPGPRPSFSPGPRPSFSPSPGSPRPSFSPSPGSRPSFSPGPHPSFSPSPGARPSGGGFRGGGMGSHGHR
jgi:hypothetical protein